jgi:hypothetical protein
MTEDILNAPDDKLWMFVYGDDRMVAGQAMAEIEYRRSTRVDMIVRKQLWISGLATCAAALSAIAALGAFASVKHFLGLG